MTAPTLRSAFLLFSLSFLVGACNTTRPGSTALANAAGAEGAARIQYLEIVTTDVAKTIHVLEAEHGVSFGEPILELELARTATLKGGGRIGVCVPLEGFEDPIVRPGFLVSDLDAAVMAAQAARGRIAIPASEVAGQGKFALYILGGIQYGLWEL